MDSIESALGDPLREIHFAAGDRVNGLAKFRSDRLLDEVACSAVFKSFHDALLVRMHGEHYNRRVGHVLFDQAAKLEAVYPRKRNIQNQHVRLSGFDLVEKLQAFGSIAYDFDGRILLH